MVKYKEQNIIYTLKYGGYATKKQKIIILVVPSILVILGIIISVLMLLYKENIWLGMIIGLIGVIILVPIIFALIVETKNDKEISIWITDENLIKTTAISWKYDTDYSGIHRRHKFGVEFNVKNDTIKKVSLRYDVFYKSIKDKEIEILYSPKYDEVMILESKQ